MGVPWAEASDVGALMSKKLALNEFVASVDFINQKAVLAAHTQVVVTFSLSGFANFSSIAILRGGISAMAPDRKKEIAQLGLNAVLAATLANFVNASLTVFFLSPN
jgi:CNT family concentrative nucleoside transporter